MANRTYLYGTNSNAIDGDALHASEMLEARYCIPLLWLCLFQAGDLRQHRQAPLLLTTREQAIANWTSRKEAISAFLGPTAQDILSGWGEFIHARTDAMFVLNACELAMMEDEGQLASDLATYFAELAEMENPHRSTRDYAVVAQASRSLCSYPYVGPALHLCGDANGATVPWPEATPAAAPLLLDSANFRIEELLPSDLPLDAAVGQLLQQAQARQLAPYVCISASWCTPCLEMFDLFADPRLAGTLDGVHLIRLDLEQWGEQFDLIGVGELSSVPVLLALNAAGMCTGRTITGDAWDDSTPEQLSRALGSFFNPH